MTEGAVPEDCRKRRESTLIELTMFYQEIGKGNPFIKRTLIESFAAEI
jgi:hypothetical protein